MKGQLLSRVATSCRPLGDILCVGFTQTQEWDARNALVTGSADGVVRVRVCVCVLRWSDGSRERVGASTFSLEN